MSQKLYFMRYNDWPTAVLSIGLNVFVVECKSKAFHGRITVSKKKVIVGGMKGNINNFTIAIDELLEGEREVIERMFTR